MIKLLIIQTYLNIDLKKIIIIMIKLLIIQTYLNIDLNCINLISFIN